MKVNKKKYIILVALIFLQLINIIYWGNKKEGFHVDELLSYNFVCQTKYISVNANRPEMTYLNNWHDSAYYRDYLTIDEGEAFDFTGTYESITHDVHPPIFYLLLNVMCSFMKGIFSKWAGIGLNIIFFVLTVLALFKLTAEITDSVPTQLAICAIYGFSVGAVSTVVFIRMYMILTLATVLFCCLHAKLWNNMDSLEFSSNRWKYYLWIVLATVFGFLTQFYFVIFAFFVCAVFWLFILLNRKYRLAVEYAVTMVTGLVISFLLWPSMYHQIFEGYRGQEAFENFKEESGGGYFRDFIGIISNELFARKNIILLLLVVLLLITIVFTVLFKMESIEKEKVGIIFNITVAVMFYVGMIAKISPYRSDRYIFNVLPLVVLVGVIPVRWISDCTLKRNIIGDICIAMMGILMLLSYKTTGVQHLYVGTADAIAISDEYSRLPVVLLTSNTRIGSSCVSICFQNGQNVYPTDQSGIDTIPGALESVGWENEFVLYIDSISDDMNALNAVEEAVGASSARWLYDVGRSTVYIIEK